MKVNFLIILAALFVISCNSDPVAGTRTAEESKEVVKETTAPEKYKLTAFTPSPSFPDAKIESMAYKSGAFKFGIGGDTYKLGVQTTDAPQKSCANSAEGQHIHLIVNNLPYAAKYAAEFDYTIPDGEHHILAFLSRSYHESIKTADAYTAVVAQVKDESITKQEKITKPMLFYSRPKGIYTGEDTKKVMLDFYMVNATMADYQVEAEINGEKHILTNWQPYYVEGLPMGDNEIKLTLQDKNGKIVATHYNPVSRIFKLEAAAPGN